jgi:UDP-N-acetylmuramate dehydrogenase
MNIQTNVSLAPYTWFKTGGPAAFFAEPATNEECQEAVSFAHANNLPLTIIGEGANILISDLGVKGLVLHPAMQTILVQENLITVGAGVGMPQLVERCLQENLGGLEEFSGIPGTVGGSLYINIHYFEWLLSSFLVSAEVLDLTTNEILSVDATWFNFGYNTSTLLLKKHLLLTATFSLKKLTDHEVWYARGRRTEIIRHRERRYPKERTCGSFFRNFFEHEYRLARGSTQVPYVAYYLESVGVKGQLKVGGASVYALHANMLVTAPGATTNDVIQLAQTMQQRVVERFGIIPQPECQLIGFETNPLECMIAQNTTSSVHQEI